MNDRGSGRLGRWARISAAPASPNPLAVAWSEWRTLQTVRPPAPGGHGTVDHDALTEPPERLEDEGTTALIGIAPSIQSHLTTTA